MFGQLSVLLFLFLFRFWGVCTGVWEWMCEWMSLPCRSCAQILDRGEGWVGRDLQHPRKRHQPPRVTRTQPGEVLNPGRTGLSWRLLERPLLSGNVAVCVEHIYKCFLSVLSPRWEGLRRGAFQRGICRAFRPSPNATLDRRGQLNEGVMFGELRVLLFVLVVWIGGWENRRVSECLYHAVLARRLCTVETDV